MENTQQNTDTKFQTSPNSSNNQPKGSKSPLKWLLVVLFVGLGCLGYTYKMTNDKLKQQSQKLSDAYGTVEKFQGIINQYQARDNFVSKYNDARLSEADCSGKPLLMSDVHVNDKYAVYRYLCADKSDPIQIGAFKKLPDGTYEFTYGSTVEKPKELPSYIYDTEPDFFGEVYGATRF